ncbi:MAG: hypothetical protein ACFFKA_01495 [Candidatus Thorarchaeota archaeon]
MFPPSLRVATGELTAPAAPVVASGILVKPVPLKIVFKTSPGNKRP